jgi:hypothetical protein
MAAYVLTEGNSDTELLKKLLRPDLLQGVELVNGRGVSSAVSLARSLLVTRRKPVALVIDADSTNRDVAQERQRSTQEVVSAVAPRVPVRIVVAVPEIEGLFFHDPKVIERLLGRPLRGEELALARVHPKESLSRVMLGSRDFHGVGDIFNAAGPAEIETFRSFPAIRELSEFLEQVQEADSKSKVALKNA